MSVADEAIILAGGFGTRLRSMDSDVPKSLAPVRGRPFVAWLLDAMAEQGLRRVILATGFMGDQVSAALGVQWRGMTLVYSQEQQPLGTGGAIVQAVAQAQGEAFFVVNGDTWLSLDYADFDTHARSTDALLDMALAQVADTSRYGAVRVEQNHVAGFIEKGCSGPGYINAGVYRLERTLLSNFPKKDAFSFETDVLVPAAMRSEVVAYTDTQEFIDIGVPQDYLRAHDELPAVRSAKC
jgi:D-glycero-alpha-D-manno-heptose 1-phosphate guanylyltransferase